MNFFKSKDPDIIEVSREKRVKESIISELSACLKAIQSTQQARKPGEPIYTSDSSNALCTVIEAVFLHGHKSTRGVGRLQLDPKSFEHCSFWPFVQRVTHKGTISQLKSLAYITTETGVCRAWVRLAVNDGLLESYLSAIVAQPKALTQYYNKTALLRDLEQPEILLKLIQVLQAANYDFQLVYNSSQLNYWSLKSLSLAGLVERQFLFDGGSTVPAATPNISSSPRRSRSSTLDMDDIPADFLTSPQGHLKGNVFLNESGSIRSGSSDQSLNLRKNSLQESAGSADNSERDIWARPASVQSHSSPRIHDTLQRFEEGEEEDDARPESLQRKSSSSFHSTGGGEEVSSRTVVDGAERELARLRTASYSIDDVIKPEPSPQLLELDNPMLLNSEHPEKENTILASHYPGVEAMISSNHSSQHDVTDMLTDISNVCRDEDVIEGAYGSPAVMGFPAANTKSIPQQHEPPTAKFVFGTPQSHSELMSSHERVASDGETDEEDHIGASISDRITAEASSVSYDPFYSHYPLSAAQAIMSRSEHPASGSQTNNLVKSPLSGNSLGSYGNSLASLSGWGNAECPAETSDSVAIEHVQSYADLVSEYKQSEEVLGSPNREYPVLPAAVLPSNGKSEVEDQPAADLSDYSQASPSSTTTDDSDDFEVVGNMDKAEYSDTLGCYGMLCNEEGLSSQSYKCYTCTAPIGIIYGDPRLCCYTKKYYCTQCHVNEDSYIAAKIVFNWDWSRYKVCKHSKDFLSSAESMPLLNLNLLNPRLYEHIPALDKLKPLRMQLFYLKRYLFACNPVIADQLKQMFWPKEYMYEEIHTYSVQDLWSANSSSSLANQLKKAIKFCRKHIQGCDSCEYRGFLCEICGCTKVIFPFDLDTTSRCSKCSSVYHKACFTGDCPKCERVRQRDSLLGHSPDVVSETNGDYSLPHS